MEVTAALETSARAFTVAAAAYVQWMERIATEDAPKTNLRELHRLLGTLQAAAADLPPIELNGEAKAASSSEETGSSENLEEARSARSLAGTVASKLPLDAYSVVFDALEVEDRGSILKSLDDDLGDIYLVLKRVLAVGQTATLVDTVWRWRFDYYTHWGRHLVHAQSAIYSYLADSGHFFFDGGSVQ
jgi:hypothetical protein